jgi:asparagine synthase (glutamine-hydrolysing)
VFAGLISKEQPVSAWGDPDKILVALAPYSLDKPRDVWAVDRQMLVQVATRTGSSTAEIYCHAESGVAVAFWGRLDNRPDLIAQLYAQHKASDDELIALAWLKWGEHCPEKLIGDFAFAVASPRTGIVFLARDVMGVKPLYYRADEHGVFFANSVAAFKPLKLGTLTRSQKWMAEYMLGLSYSHTETAYEEIKKLQCAHSLLISVDGRKNLRRYHRFVDDAPVEKKRDPKYLEAYKAAWQEAVACRMPIAGNIGAENSGGLDSGSITAELARQLGSDIERLNCFSFCLEEREPELIMATAMKFNIPETTLISKPYDKYFLDNQPRALDVLGYPCEHATATSHVPFLALCQKANINRLFSGFGGDQAVTNEGEPFLCELLDAKNFRELFNMMRGSFPRKIYHTARLAINGYRLPQINPVERAVYQERWQYSIITENADKLFGIKDLYLGQADWGRELRKVNVASLCRLQKAYMPTRTENCTLMASSFGVDYVWPLLDMRLIQQWLSSPSIWKVGDGDLGRYLHRKSVEGVCPESVTWKKNKDMGFDNTYQNCAQRNNKACFIRLHELAETIPECLTTIIDTQKIKKLALSGLKHDLRGYEQYCAFTDNVDRLEALTSWVLVSKS